MSSIALAFLAVSQALSLPPGLLSAVCYTESQHNPSAVHHDDGGSRSLGICQIKLATARFMGYTYEEKYLIEEPATNIYYAGKYLRYQLDKNNQNIFSALAAYNAGHIIRNRGKIINRAYVHKVMDNWGDKK